MGREAWVADWKALRTPLGLPGQRQALCTRKSFVPLRPELPNKPDEVHFHATSIGADAMAPGDLSQLARNPWGIENGLHHVKDRTWLEDRHWVGRRSTAVVVTMLRSLACGLVRGAKGRAMKQRQYGPERIEHFNQNPRRALKLLDQPLRL